MTKAELIKALEPYPDEIEVVAGVSPGLKYSVRRVERRTIPDFREYSYYAREKRAPVDVVILETQTQGE